MIIISEEKKTITNDLTFLNNLITFISESLDMEIDIDLYKNKIIDDVYFINTTLTKIEERYSNSDFDEIDSIAVFKKIKNVEERVIILLENIIKDKYKQTIIFGTHNDNIKSFLNIYKSNSERIQKKLNRKLSYSQEVNQVSKEELYSLFTQEEQISV